MSFPRILESISGSGNSRASVCIIGGSEDKLVSRKISERLAETFRGAVRTRAETKKMDILKDDEEDMKKKTDEVYADVSAGVRLVILKGAPHHFQNDVTQEMGAKQLLAFIEALR